jgi:hypothetical protein
VIARNVKVAESVTWNWETASIEGIKQKQQIEIDVAEDYNVIDDKLVRGTRSFTDIYNKCNVAEAKPIDFEKAINSQVWTLAMKEKLTMIKKNETWILVDRLVHKKVIGMKWIFKTKLNANGNINKYKARLVIKDIHKNQVLISLTCLL